MRVFWASCFLLSGFINYGFTNEKTDILQWLESPTDLNDDGTINALDVFLAAQRFHFQEDLFPPPTPTPDPLQANLPDVGSIQTFALQKDFSVLLDYPTGRETYLVLMRNPDYNTIALVSILDNRQLNGNFIAQDREEPKTTLRHSGPCCMIPDIHTLPHPREVETAQAQTLQPGEQRSFALFGGSTVQATLRYLGTQAAIYVDDNVWMQGESAVTRESVNREGAFFDTVTFPVITAVFGEPGDVNNDGHIAILLTQKASIADGSGFFFGGDLFRRNELDPSLPTNTMEILYVAPPGTPNLQIDEEDLAPIIAHELQHLINFYYHSLVFGGRNGLTDEDRWLDEGLSHLAEDFISQGKSNHNRRTQFLNNTATQGIFIDGFFPNGTQRGGAYLLCRYLADRFGNEIIPRLVQTARMGIPNIEQSAGVAFPDLHRDWSRAVFVSNLGITDNPRLNYTFFSERSPVNLRDWGRPFFNDLDLANLPFFGRLFDRPLAPGGFGFTVLRASIAGTYGITLAHESGPAAEVDLIRLPDQFVFPNFIAEDAWQTVILDEPLNDVFVIGEPKTITGQSADGQPLSRFRVFFTRGSGPFRTQRRFDGDVDGNRFSVTILFENENDVSSWSLGLLPNENTSSIIQPVQVVSP